MSANVTVGLLDAGVAPALSSHVVAARRFVDQPARPDWLGHGSAIARIILHHAPHALLLDATAFGDGHRTTAEAVAAGLDWLREQEAVLVNMSLGLRHDHAALKDAVGGARAAGLVMVASVPARGAPTFPGSYPGVIRVTGDARCTEDEISALGGEPADYGACPRGVEGRLGGASFAAAHVSGLLARGFDEAVGDPRALLDQLARYHGRERRLA